jgi:hypothetical protein
MAKEFIYEVYTTDTGGDPVKGQITVGLSYNSRLEVYEEALTEVLFDGWYGHPEKDTAGFITSANLSPDQALELAHMLIEAATEAAANL